MKPGSSDRCTSRNADKTLHCRLRRHHAGLHQAPRGKRTAYWNLA